MGVENKIYKWVAVGLLWGVALLNYLDRQMLTTMQPSMMIDIKELSSATNFGYLMGIFLWVYGFASPFSGIIADRYNKKFLIIGSLFVWSGVTYGMSHATSFYQLYWLRGIMGFSEAMYIPAALSLIANLHQGKTRALAIGIHMSGLILGQALGGFGATVAAQFSWEITFRSFGLVGIFYSFILLVFLRPENDSGEFKLSSNKILTNKRQPFFKGVPILFKNISFWIILFYFAVPSLSGWAIRNWLPTLFSKNLNIPMSEAGPISTITLAVSAITGVILGGFLSDKWVKNNIRGRVYTGSLGLILMIPSLFLLGLGHTFFSIILGILCFGLGFGLFDANCMPLLCQFVSSKYRATGYGIMNMVGVFSGALITQVLGKSSDAGNLGRDLSMTGGALLIAVIIVLIFLRPKFDDFS